MTGQTSRVTRPALWLRARPTALAIARDTYVRGMDADDIRQEALLAAWVASGTFDPARGPWLPYARLAVKSHMAYLIKAATRKKRTAVVVELDGERDSDPVQLELLVENRERLREGVAEAKRFKRRIQWRESKRRQRARATS